MKKRLMAALLAAVLGTGVLAGCGGGSDSGSAAAPAAESQESTEPAAEAAAPADNGEVKKIIVTWVHYAGVGSDMQAVTDAVNEITIPEIGVEVEFMPMSINDTMTKYSTYIASGERMDCMLLLFQDPLQYYNNGSLEPLNDLLDTYGQTIKGLAEEFPITATAADGNIYGFAPVDQYYGTQGCVYLKGKYADVVTLNEDPDHVYTMDELGEIFAQVKAAYPEVYPYNVVGNGINASNVPGLFCGGFVTDNMGSGVHSGVLMGTDSTTIVDLFETEEYYNYLKTVKEWFDAGYILPDAATTDSTATDLLNSDVTATALTAFNPIVYADEIANMGEGTIPLKTTVPYYASTAAGLVTWTIPVTAQEPEAAMKFYNLVYSNADLMNTIMWGIEGKHFVKTDEEGVIAFPEGVDASNSGYYNTFGVWGDRRDQYVWDPIAGKEPNEAYTALTMANKTKAGIGNYQFDTSAFTGQLANIDTVLNQYLPTLETGSAPDLDDAYNKFISALKSAGIDTIIAENQKQLDAYLEANGIQ